MEKPNTGKPAAPEPKSAEDKRRLAPRPASANGGIRCPKCDGELVRHVDTRSHLSVFECARCGYYED